MGKNSKRRRGGTNCCVFGCSKTYGNSNVSFYSFPNEKWHILRRKTWIEAVSRKNADGSDWMPTKNSRICSVHFVGGKKSDDPNSLAYIPTLKMGVKKSRIFCQTSMQQYANMKKRLTDEEDAVFKYQNISTVFNDEMSSKSTVEIQVDITTNLNQGSGFMFCSTKDNCAEVQINLPRNIEEFGQVAIADVVVSSSTMFVKIIFVNRRMNYIT